MKRIIGLLFFLSVFVLTADAAVPSYQPKLWIDQRLNLGEHASSAPTPPDGQISIYAKDDHGIYFKNSDGDELKFGTDTLTVDKIISSSGLYLSYKPNGIECSDGQSLVWVAASDRWICGSGGGTSFPLFADDGTSTDPSYSFDNETTLGLYRYGSGTMALGGGDLAIPYNKAFKIRNQDDNAFWTAASVSGQTMTFGASAVNIAINAGAQLSMGGTSAQINTPYFLLFNGSGSAPSFNLADDDGDKTFTLKSPGTLFESWTLTTPDRFPTADGQVLTGNMDGTTSWETPSGGGSFPLLAPDGTASNPSYAFSTNPGVGFYYENSGTQLHLSLGTTDSFKWSSQGFFPTASSLDIGTQAGPFDDIFANRLQTAANGQLILRNSTNSINLSAPSDLASDYAITLPVDYGLDGQVLTSGGDGTTSWEDPSGGATTALDNLASTAFNADIVPDSDGTRKLGSTSKNLATVFTNEVRGPAGSELDLYTDATASNGVFIHDSYVEIDGQLRYIDGSEGNIGDVLTSSGTGGQVTWATPASGLPSQTGNSGKFLTTNGTAASWAFVTVPTLANNTAFPIRNAANTANLSAFKADTSDNFYFGETGTGHNIFFQGFDAWFTPDRNTNFYAPNAEVNFIGSGAGTSKLGFSDQSQSNYFRIRAAASMSGTVQMVLPTAGPTLVDQVMVNDLSNNWSFKSLYDYDITITTGGTTGAQTIDKPAGSVNFAATDTSLVVTDSLVTTSTLVFVTGQTNDATCKSFVAVPASGSFEIFANAACTAETAVAFHIIK